MRILKHHLRFAAQCASAFASEFREILTVDDYPSRGNRRKVQRRLAHGRLARPGFAYETECVTLFELQIDTVDSFEYRLAARAIDLEVDLESAQFKHRNQRSRARQQATCCV